MIFYQKWGVSQGAKATTRGPFIFVDPEFKDDPGLVLHEQVHVDQFFRTFGLHPLLYLFSKAYRFRSEAEAYRVQLTCYPANEYAQRLDDYATFLAEHYDLGVTKDDAVKALRAL